MSPPTVNAVPRGVDIASVLCRAHGPRLMNPVRRPPVTWVAAKRQIGGNQLALGAGCLPRVPGGPSASPGRLRPGVLPRILGLFRDGWPYLVPALVLSVVHGSTLQRSTGDTYSLDTTTFEVVAPGPPSPPCRVIQ